MKTFIATTLCLVAGLSAGAAAANAPTVRLVARAPVALRGAGFAPGERLTVTVIAHGQRLRHPAASSTGSFSVVLADMKLGRCDSIRVSVTGSTGDHAGLRIMPECMSQ